MGKCACTEGWEGNACQCPKSNQTCLDSKGVSRKAGNAGLGMGWDGATGHLSRCGVFVFTGCLQRAW